MVEQKRLHAFQLRRADNHGFVLDKPQDEFATGRLREGSVVAIKVNARHQHFVMGINVLTQ